MEHELAEEESKMASEEIACPVSLMSAISTGGDGGGSEKDKVTSVADERTFSLTHLHSYELSQGKPMHPD